MKKIVKLVFLIISIILISLCNAKNVYGVSNCKVNLFIEKNEYKIGDEITVYVNISDIQSELGIFTGMMTLDYDKGSLELLKIEGLNSWDTPILNSSYNSDNGKMVITKSGFAKENENILKISFKAKANDENVNISIKNVSFSDSNLIRVEGASQNIVIKDEKSTIVPSEPESKEPEPTPTEPTVPDNQEQNDYEPDKHKQDVTNNNNNNQNEDSTEKNEIQENESEQNTVIEEDKNQTTIYPVLNDNEKNTTDVNEEAKSDDSKSKLKLPKTGEKNAILIISIIIFTICIIFVVHSGIGYVKSNKKIKDNDDDNDNDNVN